MIRLLRGDITKVENVDAIVNAANSSLLHSRLSPLEFMRFQ